MMSDVEQRSCTTCGLALWEVEVVYGARKWTCTTAIRWLDGVKREERPGCRAVRWSCPVCGQCYALEVGTERRCACGYSGPIPDATRELTGLLVHVHAAPSCAPSFAPLIVVKREEPAAAAPAPVRRQKRGTKATPGQGSLF